MSGHDSPLIPAIRWRTNSRLLENSASIRETHSCGPSIAASAAYWLTLEGFEVSWLCKSAMDVATLAADNVQPIRQPVIAEVLLAPLTRIVRSCIPGRTVAKLAKRWPP